MTTLLVTWLGMTDLRAAEGTAEAGLGPIGQAVAWEPFDEVHIISDLGPERTDPYLRWLEARTRKVELHVTKLTRPTAFGEIYESAVHAVSAAIEPHGSEAALTFHLSPGTPAMAAVWVILGKTRFPARLIESSAKHGVQISSVPFDITAEFLPDLLAGPDDRLRRSAVAAPPEAAQFGDIIYQCAAMHRIVERARRAAVRSVPVLIEGESGTGKELLARAIHQASPRRDKPFIPVNCGAIPAELVESELFGHEKGAFTGAVALRRGHFEAAHGGTLFLDEIGDLPLPAQVKLLRVLQDGKISRIGASTPIQVDVRVIAATHRNLLEDAREGRFRSDLFYRLAVAVLVLPPLRARQGDIGILVDHLLGQINEEAGDEPGFKRKMLSSGARSLVLRHPWPGNVRELLNTLRRAAIWSSESTISEDDLRDALFPTTSSDEPSVYDRALGDGFDLTGLLRDVARHYLGRAMAESHGNKTKAASLLGLPSYQTLTNWLNRYGVEG